MIAAVELAETVLAASVISLLDHSHFPVLLTLVFVQGGAAAGVVPVRTRQGPAEWDAAGFGQQRAFHTLLAPVTRGRAGAFATAERFW